MNRIISTQRFLFGTSLAATRLIRRDVGGQEEPGKRPVAAATSP